MVLMRGWDWIEPSVIGSSRKGSDDGMILRMQWPIENCGTDDSILRSQDLVYTCEIQANMAAATGQVPFVVYYSRVGLELSKIVFRGQSMSPP